MLGRILNTLSFQISKALKESVDRNPDYRASKWNLIEINIVKWSKNPFLYLFLTFFCISLYVCLFLIWKHSIINILPIGLWADARVVNWQSHVLVGQLTILGVIFPLVIGLIGVLLQRKSESKAIWYAYKRYSGFIFTGLSGVLLAITVTLTSSLGLSVSNDIYQSISVTLTVWFVVNIFLTGWFLWVTFKFIEENSRNILLVKFAVNEAFIDDIKRSLSAHISHRIIDSFGFKTDDYEVSTYRISMVGDEPYSISFSSPRSIENIRFRILYAAIWLLRKVNQGRKGRVVIPVYGDHYSTKFDLLIVNGLKAPWYCKVLLKSSLSFSRTDWKKDVDVESVVSAIVGSAEDSLKTDDERHFDESLVIMRYMVSQFINRLSFQDDNGESDNWLLLPEGSFSSFSYFDKLMREIYLLSKKSCQKIPASNEYYSSLGYIPLQIYSNSRPDLPKKIAIKLIDSSYSMWRNLINWSESSSLNDDHLQRQYTDALMGFIGRWENWPMYIDTRDKRWADGGVNRHLYLHHLTLSSQMVITALRFGSIEAAKWSVDTLNRWFSNVTDHSEGNYRYYWNTEILVPVVLDFDDDAEEWALIKNGREETVNAKAAGTLAVMNAWIDTRIVTACYLLKRPSDEHDDKVKILIDALVSSSELFPTGGINESHHSIESGADILSAYMRHRWYWRYGDGDHGMWINGLIDSLNIIDEPERVSGRIYSGWGANDARSLSKSYLKLMIENSRSQWTLSGDWQKIVLASFFKQANRDLLISELKEFITVIDSNSLYEAEYRDDEANKELLQNCRSSLLEIIELLKQENINKVVAKNIDQDRLNSMGATASIDVFDPEERYFPLSLFSEVIANEQLDVGSRRTVNIQQYLKEKVVDIGANVAINEGEWLSNCVRNHMVLQIFNDFLNATKHKTIEWDFNTDVDAKIQLKRDIDDLKIKGGDPVILSGGSSFFSQIFRGIYRADQQTAIERRDGYGESYICHFYGVPAYRLPYSAERFVLLTSKNMFLKASLLTPLGKSYVDVKYEEETDIKGKLSLSFLLGTEFKVDNVWKYTVNEPLES